MASHAMAAFISQGIFLPASWKHEGRTHRSNLDALVLLWDISFMKSRTNFIRLLRLHGHNSYSTRPFIHLLIIIVAPMQWRRLTESHNMKVRNQQHVYSTGPPSEG